MQAGTLLGQRYRLAEPLGSGGSGTVYRATDVRTGGSVAVKMLHTGLASNPEYVTRLRAEAAIAAGLTSPRVVRVTDLDVDVETGAPFLVMEYVAGSTLADALRERGRLPVEEALAIALEVARALAAAHQVGIVHRDLKPQNIKLVDGQIKVLDFGIARIGDAPDVELKGVYLGTPDYSAPEQASGRDDIRGDIYALGVVLFQLLVGRLPFRAPTARGMLAQHASAPLPSLGTRVPKPVQRLVARCMAKAPSARYQTPDELISALDLALADVHGSDIVRSYTAPPPERVGEPAGGTLELTAPASPPNNLPQALTSFVGRAREKVELHRLLGETRLLTLTGAGGCGKTRLALELANVVLEQYADGVWLVELSSLVDGALLPQALASVLGVREAGAESLTDQLLARMADRRMLVLLDNCEHIVTACAHFAETVLRSCPGVRILATSREVFGVLGETAWRVPSLATPHVASIPVLELAEYEAVRLFSDRAVATQPSFTLTDDNAAALVRICQQLDGIPLALELAAARVRVLTVEQIASRLDDQFRLLSGGSRTLIARHQTLRATVDWSYAMLSDAERSLFAKLAVFAGGCALDAVEAVGAIAEDGEPVLDLLARLVDKSLVIAEERTGQVRFQLLEALRQYGWERLTENGVLGTSQGAHALHYVEFGERAEAELTGPDSAAWLGRLDLEQGNLRTALHWAVQHHNAESGLRLAGALWRYWSMRGQVTEGRETLADLLGMPLLPAPSGTDGTTMDAIRAKALHSAGTLASQQGDKLAAQAFFEQSLALRRALGDTRGVASSLNNLGIVARGLGDYARARALYQESLALRRQLEDRWGVSNSLNNLGNVALDQQDYSAARALHEESLHLRRELGDRSGVANSLNNLGNIAAAVGDYPSARSLYLDSLAIAHDLADKWAIAYVLEDLGSLAAAEGQPRRALRLAAAAAALRDAAGAGTSSAERDRQGQLLSPARAALSAHDQAEVWRQGSALGLDDAIQYAVQLDEALLHS